MTFSGCNEHVTVFHRFQVIACCLAQLAASEFMHTVNSVTNVKDDGMMPYSSAGAFWLAVHATMSEILELENVAITEMILVIITTHQQWSQFLLSFLSWDIVRYYHLFLNDRLSNYGWIWMTLPIKYSCRNINWCMNSSCNEYVWDHL